MIELSVEWIGYLLIAGGVIGLAIADLTNPHSKLRVWWRYKWRIFDIEPLGVVFYGPPDHERHAIQFLLKFVKPVEGATIILRVRQLGRAGETSKDFMTDVTKAKGSELRLHIANVETWTLKDLGVVWGNPQLPMGKAVVSGPCKCVATIDLQTKGVFPRQQTFSLYLETFAFNETGSPIEPLKPESKARFFYATEGENLLDPERKGIRFGFN